jgi:pentatricopeptide repeat protein
MKLGRQALEVAASMAAAGVVRSVVTYNTLVDAYAREGDGKAARALLAEMRADGVSDLTICFLIIILIYLFS